MRRTTLLALLSVLAMGACSASLPRAKRRAGELEGTSWELLRIDGHERLATAEIVLTFRDGDAVGSAGVNDYRARVDVGEGTISVAAIDAGELILDDPPGVVAQEDRYFEALRRVDGWERVAGRLILALNGEPKLVFTATGPDQPR